MSRLIQVPRVEAMTIERLMAQLDSIWSRRLGLVVAPPGSGKSTLLATFASRSAEAVTWYRADRWDSAEDVLVRRLAAAFGPLIDADVKQWSDMDDVATALAAWDPPQLLLVIDDLHTLDGTASQEALEWLLQRMPSGVRVLAASRTQPAFNVSRLRVSGELLEIGPDDLRFRAWEVERLYRDHYDEPMAPEDLAHLARWTEGWAAGLQLFHLATQGRPADERRRVLRSLGPRSRLAREYLTQNALDRVDGELRRFLIDSSVLGMLTGPLCDRLLQRSGSEALLEELERRCLFTTRVDELGHYRYHEVFRSHLQSVLITEIGDVPTRDRFIDAGNLFISEGMSAQALEAYVRAEAWELVDRVLETEGEAIAGEPLRWLSLEAQRSRREDPWMGLAGARRLRAEGRFHDAVAAYALVASDARSAAAAEAARGERAALVAWFEPDQLARPSRNDTWWSSLRQALEAEPGVMAERGRTSDDAASQLVRGICLLLAGEVRQARAELAHVAERPDAEGLLACIASLVRGAAAALADDDPELAELNGAIGAAEGLGWDWLARVGRSLLAVSGRPDHQRDARKLEEVASIAGDQWGVAIARMARTWGRLVASDRSPTRLDDDDPTLVAEVARELQVLRAPVLAWWLEAIGSLSSSLRHQPDATDRAPLARSWGWQRSPDSMRLLDALADALDQGDASVIAPLRDRLAADHGIELPLRSLVGTPPVASIARTAPAATQPSPERPTAPGPPAVLRLFGGLKLEIGGQDVDLAAVRPRVRMLLQLLALHTGSVVHREVITEALWPEAEPTAASRNLHVAIASLRRVLEPSATRGSFRFVLRDGEGYRLAPPPGSWVDVVTYAGAIDELRSAVGRDDVEGMAFWCRIAIDGYGGELLPEVGPVDWVVARRDLLRMQFVEASTVLAQILLDQGSGTASATISAAGLQHDRYHDPLWRILIKARELSGDMAAATSARSGYRRALAELGIDAQA